MKIMTQDKTRVLNFKMTYISYVSKNRICEGDFGIAEYASPERAKEVLNDMFQKYAAGKGQGDGNTYNVTVNASGRKLLDIIISEAEMRRRRNGKNPFELV